MFPRFRAPETMTAAEQAALLRATAGAPRDHLLYSMALGTGLRLRELLGLNVGDVSPDGRTVRTRILLRTGITKGSRRGEVFLPARLVPKLRRFLSWKRSNGQAMDRRRPAVPLRPGPPPVAPRRPVALRLVAAAGRVRPAVQLPRAAALGGDQRLPGDEEPLPGAAVCAARAAADDDHLHAPGG